MSTYKPLAVEEEIRKFWKKENIFEKTVKLRAKGPLFKFLEGPPTANGFMHVGHARGRTMKDVILRFKTMQGYNVWRRAGWDCHGLPVELEVEKKLGIKNKKEIASKIGVKEFVNRCQELVDYYISFWRESSEMLGLWLDYDNAYETRKEHYIENVWHTLKIAFERGLLVKSYRVVPVCPHCQTPLSSHEVAQGYKEREDPSIYVKFKIIGNNNDWLLIWTTTPWTLPANMAVSVNPEFEYVKVKVKNEFWYIAKGLLKRVMEELKIKKYEIVEEVIGKKLEGIKYIHPLLNEVPRQKEYSEKYHRVILGEHVTLEEGTGLVHTAPAHGPEDFEMAKKYRLPVFNPVDDTGHYTAEGGKYSGLYVFNANNIIIKDLKRKGVLVKSGKIRHIYPHCWRCGTPLIYRADEQWFIRVKPLKEKLIEENKKIYWNPSWAGKSRFGDWIANAEDWCLSRTRYWGTPLNIWKCKKCGYTIAIGSKEELKKLAINPPENIELHRPQIDEIKLKCPKCGGEMVREPYVIDVWFDSGMAHTASIDGLRNKELFEKLFPFDFITEAIDQTRGWFYSLLFTSVMLYNEAPFKSVLCQGHVLDKYSRKMSKSKGNVVWAIDVIKSKGADPLRVYLMIKASPWDSLAFDLDEIKNVVRDLNIVWNVFLFAYTYMSLDKYNPGKHKLIKEDLKIEDLWILSRVNSVLKNVTEELEKYNIHIALRSILDFIIEDLSHNYIRLIRRRVWIEENTSEKISAYTVLFYILWRINRILAPFTPFLAEKLYQKFIKPIFNGPESIHMAEWPRYNKSLISLSLENKMKIIRDIVSLSLAARQKAGIKLRWPVNEVVIQPKSKETYDAIKSLEKVLRDQINTKKIKLLNVNEEPEFVILKARPIYREIGRKYRKRAGEIFKAIENLTLSEIKGALKSGTIKISIGSENISLSLDDLEVLKEYPKEYSWAENTNAKVFISRRLSESLLDEAVAREIVRRVQYMRKELELEMDAYINAVIDTDDNNILKALREKENYIKSETRIKDLRIEKVLNKGFVKQWNIEGANVKIEILKDIS